MQTARADAAARPRAGERRAGYQKKQGLPKQKLRENSSGKRGIRTLETLLTSTRFPVVRLRPAQPSFHLYEVKKEWCERRDLNPHVLSDTSTSS